MTTGYNWRDELRDCFTPAAQHLPSKGDDDMPKTETLKKLKLRPLEDYLLVDPSKPEDVSPGGIVLPERAREQQFFGRVVAVGPGRRLENGNRQEMNVRVGQTVYYTRFGGNVVEVDGRELLVMRESDLLAIVEE